MDKLLRSILAIGLAPAFVCFLAGCGASESATAVTHWQPVVDRPSPDRVRLLNLTSTVASIQTSVPKQAVPVKSGNASPFLVCPKAAKIQLATAGHADGVEVPVPLVGAHTHTIALVDSSAPQKASQVSDEPMQGKKDQVSVYAWIIGSGHRSWSLSGVTGRSKKQHLSAGHNSTFTVSPGKQVFRLSTDGMPDVTVTQDCLAGHAYTLVVSALPAQPARAFMFLNGPEILKESTSSKAQK